MSCTELYCTPGNRSELTLSPDWRTLHSSMDSFPIVDQIPDFLGQAAQGMLNDKYMRFYDKVSLIYKLGAIVTMPFSKRWSDELLGDLEIHPGDHVLETSVGTGHNLRYLSKRYPNAVYYGMDISCGMLRECRKSLKKWGLSAHLARANAEALPYPDQRFDLFSTSAASIISITNRRQWRR